VRSNCGLILELHGDTGTGLLEDAHLKLRDLGVRDGYIVVAPTGPPIGGGDPGSTWSSANDAALVAIVRELASAYRADMKRIHVTGFARRLRHGGVVCDHVICFCRPHLAGASTGGDRGERTCSRPFTRRHGRFPVFDGRTDAAVGYRPIVAVRRGDRPLRRDRF
jgi:poly(3-hydroxybutyrate) depolymerase